MESSVILYDLILGRIDATLLSTTMSSQANSVKEISENLKAFLLFSKLPEIVLQSGGAGEHSCVIKLQYIL